MEEKLELLEALITIVLVDVNYLSCRGQMKLVELTKEIKEEIGNIDG